MPLFPSIGPMFAAKSDSVVDPRVEDGDKTPASPFQHPMRWCVDCTHTPKFVVACVVRGNQGTEDVVRRRSQNAGSFSQRRAAPSCFPSAPKDDILPEVRQERRMFAQLLPPRWRRLIPPRLKDALRLKPVHSGGVPAFDDHKRSSLDVFHCPAPAKPAAAEARQRNEADERFTSSVFTKITPTL